MRYPREKLLCFLVNSCGGKGNCIIFASFRPILFSVAAKSVQRKNTIFQPVIY